jgi:hypothetical protein
VSHWKATIHIYSLKKVQKIKKIVAFTTACPESLNPTYGSPRPLGVNRNFNVHGTNCRFTLKFVVLPMKN